MIKIHLSIGKNHMIFYIINKELNKIILKEVIIYNK